MHDVLPVDPARVTPLTHKALYSTCAPIATKSNAGVLGTPFGYWPQVRLPITARQLATPSSIRAPGIASRILRLQLGS